MYKFEDRDRVTNEEERCFLLLSVRSMIIRLRAFMHLQKMRIKAQNCTERTYHGEIRKIFKVYSNIQSVLCYLTSEAIFYPASLLLQ